MNQVKEASKKTRDKYGLDSSDWAALVAVQGGTCAICRKLPASGQLYIDHQHLVGYAKLTSQARRLAVRGLLCYQCNRFRVSKNTYLTALAVVEYLEKHEDRKRRQANTGV